jgi:hypothetical protein
MLETILSPRPTRAATRLGRQTEQGTPVSPPVFSRPDGSEDCTGSGYRRNVQSHRTRVSTYLVIGGRVWWALVCGWRDEGLVLYTEEVAVRSSRLMARTKRTCGG